MAGVRVVMRARTGLVVAFSTTGLAVVAAAALTLAELDPVVARHQPRLAAQRHRLLEVGEEAAC